jgi:type IV pilus assembly protein PilC
MEILITTLFVPLVGALLLIAEWQSRTAFGRSTRANWRLGLRCCAIALVPVAAGMIWHTVGRLANHLLLEQIVPSIARVLMIVAACRGAYRAWQVALMGDYYTAQPADMLRQSRPRDELRLCGWILLGFPLLWALVPALLLIAPLLFAVALIRMGSRVERTRFLWTMAIAVEHGMNLADEIDGFAGGARWRTRERYMALAGRVRDGARLSDALSADGQVASAEVIAAIRVAEQTGSLGATLRAAAVRNQQGLTGAQSDGSVFAMICYCWVVLVVLMSVASSMSYWIAPKLVEIFKDFEIELPPLTAKVFDMSAGSPLFMLLVVPLLAIPAAVLLLLSTRSVDDGSGIIWGPLSWIFPRRDAPGVLRWLALAVEGRRPLPAVITDIAERLPNRNLGLRLLRAVQSIEAGGEPWESLSRESFLSRREVAAVQAAERAGSAPLALNAIADALERARLQRILWWIEWLRPMVMVIFGVLVAVYCIAYFLPLVTMIWKQLES